MKDNKKWDKCVTIVITRERETYDVIWCVYDVIFYVTSRAAMTSQVVVVT